MDDPPDWVTFNTTAYSSNRIKNRKLFKNLYIEKGLPIYVSAYPSIINLISSGFNFMHRTLHTKQPDTRRQQET